MLRQFLVQVLWAMLSTLGFGLMYQMRTKKLLFAALGGALSWSVYYLCMRAGMHEMTSYAVAAGTGTLFSEIMARLLKNYKLAYLDEDLLTIHYEIRENKLT